MENRSRIESNRGLFLCFLFICLIFSLPLNSQRYANCSHREDRKYRSHTEHMLKITANEKTNAVFFVMNNSGIKVPEIVDSSAGYTP